MKNISLIIFVLLLISCTSQSLEKRLAVVLVEATPTNSQPVPTPPKIKTIDWQSSLLSMVQQLQAVDGIDNDSLLLVNTMQNATNGIIQTGKATAVLNHLIANANSKFQLIDADKLNTARQKLKISADDSLESRSKAVGLARQLNAKYVLYSTAIGDVKFLKLNLQLILVKTGEIIWFSNSAAEN
ncbi:MAG: penicillin-binding protein activator LpoB [Sodalis sp. (in: enterobacteria)]